MKFISFALIVTFLFSGFSFANAAGTSDRTSYIITLNPKLNDSALDLCLEDICNVSGNNDAMECEIISRRFKIAAANLSNVATSKVKALTCVKSLRVERFDFEPRPRVGLSN